MGNLNLRQREREREEDGKARGRTLSSGAASSGGGGGMGSGLGLSGSLGGTFGSRTGGLGLGLGGLFGGGESRERVRSVGGYGQRGLRGEEGLAVGGRVGVGEEMGGEEEEEEDELGRTLKRERKRDYRERSVRIEE